MKKIYQLLLLSLISGGLQAQKTINDENAELRSVGGFHSISVSGGIRLYLSEGEEAVAVSAKDGKTKERIRTEVKDGVLKIFPESRDGVKLNWGNNNELRAYVSFKELRSLNASGGTDVTLEGAWKGDMVQLHVTGGSEFTGRIDVKEMKLQAEGGTDINLSGRAENLAIMASGASDVNGYDLSAESCYIEASGASDVSITAVKEIWAEASGASDINWKGSASIKKVQASGAGSVNHKS